GVDRRTTAGAPESRRGGRGLLDHVHRTRCRAAVRIHLRIGATCHPTPAARHDDPRADGRGAVPVPGAVPARSSDPGGPFRTAGVRLALTSSNAPTPHLISVVCTPRGRENMQQRTRGLLVTALFGLATLISACTQPPPQGPPRQTGEPAAAPAPAPPGAPSRVAAPALGVKVDNVAAARPPTGLAPAEVVYVEPVEGGFTRLLALYGEQKPPVVGPVRSARESDLQLLAQYG